MATTTTLHSQKDSWIERFKRRGYGFKFAILATFAIGIYLHLTRLFIGVELLLQYVATPIFDKLFFWPMLYAAVSGLLVSKRVIHPSTGHRMFWRVIVGYILISLPIHASTYLTNSTEMLRFFPDWYSAVFLVFITFMTLFVSRLRLRDIDE